MIAKLTLWICYGLAAFAFIAAFISLIAACWNASAWQVFKFSAALCVFFATAGRMVQPEVESLNRRYR